MRAYGVLSHADFNCAPLPDKIDFVEASSMGCRYVTAFHGILDQGKVQADETVVVYGCGGVGLSAIQICSGLGARVIAVDLDDRKLELAKQVGATDVINGKKTDPVKAVMDLTHGGADVSVDALGIATTCRNAILSLRKRGRHIQIGLTTQGEKGEVALPIDQIVFKEIQIHRLAGDSVVQVSGAAEHGRARQVGAQEVDHRDDSTGEGVRGARPDVEVRKRRHQRDQPVLVPFALPSRTSVGVGGRHRDGRRHSALRDDRRGTPERAGVL